MKLWVVGESNPEPEEWSIWSEASIVIANTKEEAIELDGRDYENACEIIMDRPQLLIRMPEPAWGSDL